MPLFCSREVFEALDGVRFPATKEDLLDLAELKDASEAVIVVLNGLRDDLVYRDISEVCEYVRVACNYETVRTLSHAPFPARREDLIRWAISCGVPASVMHALEALPSGYTFANLDEMCEFIL